jgi:hypothetical protein
MRVEKELTAMKAIAVELKLLPDKASRLRVLEWARDWAETFEERRKKPRVDP